MKVALKNKKHSAFSLVEMLVVIAVIGVIAAIAVPNISKINRGAKFAKDQRNAQQIASVVSAADAAGYDFVAEGGDDLAGTIDAGRCRLHPLTASTKTRHLKALSSACRDWLTAEKEGAENFLSIDAESGRLVYDGTQTAPTDDAYN